MAPDVYAQAKIPSPNNLRHLKNTNQSIKDKPVLFSPPEADLRLVL
jgi:hypothetical protein